MTEQSEVLTVSCQRARRGNHSTGLVVVKGQQSSLFKLSTRTVICLGHYDKRQTTTNRGANRESNTEQTIKQTTEQTAKPNNQ